MAVSRPIRMRAVGRPGDAAARSRMWRSAMALRSRKRLAPVLFVR